MFRNIRHIAIIMGCTGFFIIAQPAFSGELPSANELYKAVRKNEANLLNVQVKGAYDVEEWHKNDGKWKQTGRAEVTAYYIGVPGSKVRIDFHRDIGRWVNGPADFAENEYSVAYNGRVGQRLVLKVGSKDETEKVLRGEIDSKRPSIVTGWGGYASGWEFSSYGLFDKYGKKLSGFFEAAEKSKIEMLIGKVQFEGAERIQLICKEPNKSARILYLAPEKEFAVVGFEYKEPNGVVTNRFIVEQLIQSSPGIFYPGKVVRHTFNNTGQLQSRSTFVASSVIANDPGFTEDVFTIHWPPGTPIWDKTSDIAFNVGMEIYELDRNIDKQLERIETEMHTQTRASLSEMPEPQGSKAISTQHKKGNRLESKVSEAVCSSTQWQRYFWLGLSICGAIVILLLALWHRWRCLCGIFLLGLGLTFTGVQGFARTTPLAVQEIREQHVYNCGFYTTLFLLKYMGTDTNIAALQSEMGVGEQWEHPCSMYIIKASLQKQGLKVEPYKNSTAEDILESLGDNRVCVLHTTRKGATVGHYYVIIKHPTGRILVVNAGVREYWFSEDEYYRFFDGRLSGYALLIEDSRSYQKVFDLGDDLIEVNVGTVRPGQGNLVFDIPIINRGAKPLTIVDFKGSCGCLKSVKVTGAVSDRVEIGIRQTLRLTFDRSVLGAGRLGLSVLVRVQSLEERNVVIRLLGEVLESERSKGLAWLPEKIDYGFAYSPEAFQKHETIRFLVPGGVRVSLYKLSSSIITVQRMPDDTREKAKADGGRRVVSFQVKIHSARKPFLREFVEFKTTDPETPKIVIPIVGELRSDDSQHKQSARALQMQ